MEDSGRSWNRAGLRTSPTAGASWPRRGASYKDDQSRTRSRWLPNVVLAVVLVALVGATPSARAAQAVEPINYTVRFPAPDKHIAEVEAIYPTEGRAAIELMMPVWTPGFYRVENYAGQVRNLSARTPDGQALHVEQPRKNR
jgi:hypothetical protein